MPCGDCKGCWTTGEVNVGYRSYRIVVPGPAAVRIGPDEHAPVVRTDAGKECWITKGGYFARISTRNPDRSDTPPLRAPRNGWVWGYSRKFGKSGWVPERALAFDDASDATKWADGPAHRDFHVGFEPCHSGQEGGCKGGHKSDHIVIVQDKDHYLRYAPESTPFYYLVRGDRIRVRYAGGPYSCVEVLEGRWCPVGTRGWVKNTSY